MLPQPQPVEIHHRGIWYSGELIGWRHESDGRVAARVRCCVHGLRHSTWKVLADLRLPTPSPPRAERFRPWCSAGPSRCARGRGRRHAPACLLAAMRGSGPSKPTHAVVPPPAAPAPAGRRPLPPRHPADAASTRGSTVARPTSASSTGVSRAAGSRPAASPDHRRRPVGPHHQPGGRAGSPASPRPPRPRVGGGGVDVGPGQRVGDDRDRGDARRAAAGAGVDEVLPAVRGAGGRDRAGRAPAPRRRAGVGSRGSSMPIRQAGPSGSSVRQTRSPPADRQKSVSGSARSAAAARSAAQPLTTPLGSSTRRPSGPARWTSNAPPDSPLGRLPERQHLGHLGRAVGQVDLAAAAAGRSPSRPGRC